MTIASLDYSYPSNVGCRLPLSSVSRQVTWTQPNADDGLLPVLWPAQGSIRLRLVGAQASLTLSGLKSPVEEHDAHPQQDERL